MKECTRCGLDLPLEAFYRSSANADGRAQYCKACSNARQAEWCAKNAERRLAWARERERNRDRETINAAMRAYRMTETGKRATLHGRLRQNHGISLEQYESMVAAQNGVCAICTLPPGGESHADKRLHVDHDHATGRIRGLLCRYCNTAVGLLRDDPDLMLEAVRYLDTATRMTER